MSPNHQRVFALALAGSRGADVDGRQMDHEAVERAARDLLRGLGADVARALRGLVRDDVRSRQEFLALTDGRSHEQ